jgi:hypothetical protein
MIVLSVAGFVGHIIAAGYKGQLAITDLWDQAKKDKVIARRAQRTHN